MNLHAFEMQMQRLVLLEIAVGIIAILITAWISYVVLKAAIRDGIKESGLVDSWERTVAKEREKNLDTRPAGLPDIRAER